MGKKTAPSNVSQFGIDVRNAWVQVGSDQKLAGMELEEFVEAADATNESEMEIKRLESQLMHARNIRDDNRYELWQIIKRVRLAARVEFGEDSSEYELFGGTRTSEHKSRVTPRQDATPTPVQTGLID